MQPNLIIPTQICISSHLLHVAHVTNSDSSSLKIYYIHSTIFLHMSHLHCVSPHRIFRMGPDGIWPCFRSLCFSKLFTCFERFVDKYRHSVGAKFEMR